MQHSYDLFSFVYRELIVETGHLERELALVNVLLEKHKIGFRASILDAACGTGDLLYHLRSLGYVTLTGMDISPGMLNRAKEILPADILVCQSWVDLNDLYRYDLILILSVSLLHAERSDLLLTLRNLYNALKPGGTLIFDNRQWKPDALHGLAEAGRLINQQRFLQRIKYQGKTLHIFDRCSYRSGRQIITYTLAGGDINEQELDVSYLMMPTEAYYPLLLNVGFSHVEHYEIANWPYEIIYARC